MKTISSVLCCMVKHQSESERGEMHLLSLSLSTLPPVHFHSIFDRWEKIFEQFVDFVV